VREEERRAYGRGGDVKAIRESHPTLCQSAPVLDFAILTAQQGTAMPVDYC